MRCENKPPAAVTSRLFGGHMRVLVAGATGAIGRSLISALVASRREVIGITSTERGVQTLRDKGAEVLVACLGS